MGAVWKLLLALAVALLMGEAAGIATGVTGAAGLALIDDVALFLGRYVLQAAGETQGLSVTETFALSTLFDELVKLRRAIATTADEQNEDREWRDHYVRFGTHLHPGALQYFNAADAGLLWWSAKTLYESDTLADALGVLGEAEVLL